MANKLNTDVRNIINTQYQGQVKVIVRPQVQPWHVGSIITHEAGLAVSTHWIHSITLYSRNVGSSLISGELLAIQSCRMSAPYPTKITKLDVMYPISCSSTRKSTLIFQSKINLRDKLVTTLASSPRKYCRLKQCRNSKIFWLSREPRTVATPWPTIWNIQVCSSLLDSIGKSLTCEIVKFSRQNGIHVSPSVLWDGLLQSEVSSSWGQKEWSEFFSAKVSAK